MSLWDFFLFKSIEKEALNPWGIVKCRIIHECHKLFFLTFTNGNKEMMWWVRSLLQAAGNTTYKLNKGIHKEITSWIFLKHRNRMPEAQKSNNDLWSLVPEKITQRVVFWLERKNGSCSVSEEVKGQPVHRYFLQCSDVLIISRWHHHSELFLHHCLDFGRSNKKWGLEFTGSLSSYTTSTLAFIPFKSLFPIRCLNLFFIFFLRNS